MTDKDLDEFNEVAQDQHVRPLAFDPAPYMEHVADLDMTEDQKIDFLRTLWDIMAAFVRLGFGVESVIPLVFNRASGNSSDALQEPIPTHDFNVASEEEADGKANPSWEM